MPRSPALDALDPQHVELADQVAEDGRAVAGHKNQTPWSIILRTARIARVERSLLSL